MSDDNPKFVIRQAGHNPRTQRLESITILAPEHRPVAALPHPFADVVGDSIAEHAIQRRRPAFHLAGVLPDDHRQLTLRLHRPGTVRRHHNVSLGTDKGVYRTEVRLRELGIVRRGSPPLRHPLDMPPVIWPGGVKHRRNNRRQQPHLAQSVSCAGIRRLLHRTALHRDNLIIHHPPVADSLPPLKPAPNHTATPSVSRAPPLSPHPAIVPPGKPGVKGSAMLIARKLRHSYNSVAAVVADEPNQVYSSPVSESQAVESG